MLKEMNGSDAHWLRYVSIQIYKFQNMLFFFSISQIISWKISL